MHEVTKEEFMEIIYRGKLNVHPFTNGKFHGLLESRWEFLETRKLFGISSQDCSVRPNGPKRYFLEESK